MDLPLLVFRAEGEPVLLFSPAQGTSQIENQQQAQALVTRLRESLGAAWQEEWLANPLAVVVARQVLPAVLSDDQSSFSIPERFRQEYLTSDPAGQIRGY